MGTDNTKNDVGRPTVFTKELVRKLEASLQNGFTIDKACYLAQIGRTTFYDECERNDNFRTKMDRARKWAEERARQNVVKAIEEEDVQTSRWYLERKAKDEFGSRTELTGAGGAPLDTGKEDLKAIADNTKKIAEQEDEIRTKRSDKEVS